MNPDNRKILIIILATAVCLAVIYLGWQYFRPGYRGPWLSINNVTIKLEIAKSQQEQARGLSGREALPSGQGMLFVSDKYYKPRFWMKDMLFPIDIIWIRDNRVVGYEKYLLPEGSQPKMIYEPVEEVNNVLEVYAGFTDDNNVKIGDQVIIKY